ncbi:hypothetical protein HK100_011405 [Physocladia obscura]|uniref:Uncharacterized protein n=1 Tax=Physocladia obscura TaxID=109957 RepID=A0AAD5TA79_9FUNG|nr:hypothetical protein HK100_011405 [Physocladia obscura]
MLGINALGLGGTWWALFTTYSCIANFYLSTWEEYYTGVLYLSEFSGPVEGVLVMCTLFFVVSVHGKWFYIDYYPVCSCPSICWTPIGEVLPSKIASLITIMDILEFPINKAFVLFGLSVVVPNVIGSFINVRAAIASNPESAAKAKKFSPLISLLPFPILITATLVFPFLAPEAIVSSRAVVPFILGITFTLGHQVGNIIVAHISKRVFPFTEMIVPGLVVVGGSLTGAAGIAVVQAAFSRTVVFKDVFVLDENTMWAFAVTAAIVYFVWFVRIVADLCDIFDIYCLTIKHKKAAGSNSSEAHADDTKQSSPSKKKIKKKSMSRN